MTKVRGHGNITKASFDGRAKSSFPSLKDTSALVLLSIKGNEYCTGEYLGAIVEQAVSTHETTTFLVADELYWHNLKEANVTAVNDVSEENHLKTQAAKLGSEYIESNLGYFLSQLNLDIDTETFNRDHADKTIDEKIDIINKLASQRPNSFQIIRWADWVKNDPKFIENRDNINALYATEPTLRRSIAETAANFANRHNIGNDKELWNKRSVDYLCEESPAIILIAASLGYNFIIYPGEMPKPFQATKEFFIKDIDTKRENDPANDLILYVEKPHLLANWLVVNFKRSEESKKTVQSEVLPMNLELSSEITPQKSQYRFFSSDISSVNKHKPMQQQPELAEIFKGITEGIFSLPASKDEKIELLNNVVCKFLQKRATRQTCSPTCII